jgi:hypothetical protein
VLIIAAAQQGSIGPPEISIAHKTLRASTLEFD